MWMLPGSQPALEARNKLAFEAVAACAAIDQYGSLTLCMTERQSFNADKFYNFVEAFIAKATRPCTLVLDNLNIHRTTRVRELCAKHGVSIVYNGTYSSQYMPVERLWLFAKLYWRKEVATIANFKNRALISARITKCI